MAEHAEYLIPPDFSEVHGDLAKVPPVSLYDSLHAVVAASPEEQDPPKHVNSSNSQDEASTRKLSAFWVSLVANINRIQALLRTSSGQDAALASVEYLTQALHHLSGSRNYISSHRLLKYFLRGHGHRYPAYNHTSRIEPPHNHLLDLSSLFENARCTVRLLGLLSIWANVPDMLRSPSNDEVALGIGFLQVLALSTYQLLENIGHLASNCVLPTRLIGPKSRMSKFSMWGARALSLHFVLELYKLRREARLARKPVGASKPSDNGTPVPESGIGRSEKDRSVTENRKWRERAWSASIWGILCLYWSSGRSISLVDKTTGGMSFLADYFAFRDLWIQAKG